MELAKETRDRIFAAADLLYEQADRAAFPTVDAVRKTAKVNMNDASAGMKEWRRAQTAQAAPVAVQVPDVVRQANSIALSSLWQEAQELANESLRAAQSAWDTERLEADTLNKQMADAYEVQALELEAVQANVEHLAAENARLATELEDTRRDLVAAKVATERADTRVIEIELRATDLRTELDYSHKEADQARAELATVRQAHAADIEGLRAELAAMQTKAEETVQAADTMVSSLREELVSVKAKADAALESYQEQRKQAASEVNRSAERLVAAQAERDLAQKAASQAREETAELRGRIDTLKEQNAEMLKMFKLLGEKQAPQAKND